MRKFKMFMFRSPDDGGGASGNVGADAGTVTSTDTGTAQGENNSGGQDADKSQAETKNTGDVADASKKYTEEDISKLKAEFAKQLQDASTKAEEEALKKASMKPDEKAQYEQDQKLADIQRREQEAAQRELKLDTLEILESKQLPKEFADYVLGTDKESTQKRIEAFKPLFDKAVQAQVEIRLKGKTPDGGNGSPKTESQAIAAEFEKAMGRFS